ncbi:PREDICTED: transmembrane protein 97 [Nelumbo nucifera]|uniref:Transmembrane protein 97 n=1 Tax=Nelumbo nucifera TaxID=4432 RepID=A0A1U8B8P6_NELNU|nr:PREDICTED: transmembrane protein 97 [Nelumbo nucifera]
MMNNFDIFKILKSYMKLHMIHNMGLCKLVDAILFFFFLLIAVVAPLIDAQTCLPLHMFPDFLVDLKSWYAREYGDYLIVEKPGFFVGIVWLELLLQWPLSIANLYGIVAKKSWMKTTCLIYGVSTLSTMVAILGELMGSGKTSDKLLKMYFPFLGFTVLAILRGVVPQSNKASSDKLSRPMMDRKKRID